MAQIEIESLTEAQLIKRKKTVLFILGISYGIGLICLALLLMLLMSEEQKSIRGLIPGMLLPVITLPVLKGLKKINEELIKRQGH